jgi:hypothetical protein
MKSGQNLTSSDGKATLELDKDCNLQIKKNGTITHNLERSQPEVKGPCYLKINKKGSLILVSSNFKIAVLARSPESDASYYQLALTNRGYLRIYTVNKAWELGVKPRSDKMYVDEDQYLTEGKFRDMRDGEDNDEEESDNQDSNDRDEDKDDE